MKKNFFLMFCAVFLIMNCKGSSVDSDPEQEIGGQNKPRGKGSKLEGAGSADIKACEGDQYTIYSEEFCPSESGPPDDELGGEWGLSRQKAHTPVDIFFVVNASNSMWYYLETAFQKRFKSFLPILNLGGLNWRIFFTNTYYTENSFWGGRNGKAMKLEGWGRLLESEFLEESEKDHQNIFMHTLTRAPDPPDEEIDSCHRPPYCGRDVEPLKALKASFSANRHLSRKSADFVVIILSNKDEQAPLNTSAQDIINEFKAVYGAEKKLSVLSLIVRPGDTQCYKKNKNRTSSFLDGLFQQNPSYGEEIAKLAKKAGGGVFSICMKDYSPLAEAILRSAK